jgi:hypothetical protein
MTPRLGTGLIAAAAALAVASLSGCSEPEKPAAGTNSASGQPAQPPAAPTPVQAEFGKQQAAGHLEFTLNVEPEKPKVGEVKFLATIGHHGEPHGGATVNLMLNGPPATTDDTSVKLAQTFTGKYEGTAKLTEGGDWEAKVDVSDGHDAQSFLYKFTVAK